MTIVIVPVLALTYRRFRFSDRSYIQGAIFLILHAIGSYYTYSETPIGQWLSAVYEILEWLTTAIVDPNAGAA